jgi:uncharacterized repeat protein (TIGR02543 family)
MTVKRIGLLIIMAFLIFGCKPEADPPPPDDNNVPPEVIIPKVTITYNMNGGTPNYTAVKVPKGSQFGLQYQIPARSGFIFGGWYAENDASYSTEYKKTTIINDDITLKARWFMECTVTFNTDGGSTAPETLKIAEGSSIGDKYPPVPTKTGNTFNGWYDESDNKYEKTTAVTVDINLKAKWTAGAPPTYTVTFDSDGGSPTPSPVNIVQGAIIGAQFPSAVPSKEGYNFDGWYNGSTRYYAATAVNSNITLKANWVSASAQVNQWNGFSTSSETTASLYDSVKSKTNVLLVRPTAAAYGWNVMSYSLTSYVGKEVTINMSIDIWIDTAAKIVWQVNNTAYSIIIGNDQTPISTIGQWVTLTGNLTYTVTSGNVIYLSGGGSGGQLASTPIPIYMANLVLNISESGSPVTPPDPNTIFLTVGDTSDLKLKLNSSMTGKPLTWSSSDASKVSVNNGIITTTLSSFTSAEGGAQRFTVGPAKAPVTITATATSDSTSQTFSVVATTEAQIKILDLPPLKNQFPAGILAGNIATGSDSGASSIINSSLIRHFNALTPENDMKPNAVSNGRAANGVISYTWANADRFVNAAYNSGFKVIGHTLLWHSQIPAWQTSMASAGKATALAAMKQFITDVMTRYKGKIYSWDVLNEVFPDGVGAGSDWKTVMRQENPWFKAIGSDFVYEAYCAARLADPDAILYYNDYNTDQVGKATMIRNMVRDVNNRFKEEYPNNTRLLIEGIGMQEHHNTSVSAANIRATLNLFKPLGVKVSVSELDVLGQDWGSFSAVGQGANKNGQSTITNNGLVTQAGLYQQYMAVYMDFKDIIERISLWGVTDNLNWRSAGLPLLFDHNSKAKPAYYRFVGAIN